MKEIIEETLVDNLKLIPFLFLTFLFIEFLEHKFNNQKVVSKAGKFGPFIGSILGAFPQCGFSASITNLYATRIVTIGTLMAVYLSTSDEMLPIMISNNVDIKVIINIILLKILIGMLFGIIIDFILRKKQTERLEIKELCEHDHCHCEDGIFFSSLKHTLSIFIYLLLISFLLNIGFEYLGEDALANLFLKDSIFSPFISSLIGLIPNCGSSVIITELYLSNTISFGSAMAGLLTGTGIGILVLFKVNKNMKENIKILFALYAIGVVCGIIINLINLI